MTRLLPMLALVVLLALAACNGERDAAVDEANVKAPEQPSAGEPLATADDLADDPSEPVPAAGGGAGTPAPGTIRFDGFGSAAFGANAESVRMAWGKHLGSVEPESPEGCYFLFPEPRPEGRYRLAFMLDGGGFRRLDIGAKDITAPGGGGIGMTADEIEARYPGQVERRPHEYSDGQYLRIANPSGQGVLVFATDGAGRVTEWRIGLPPQVDYVEGCS